MLIYVTTETKMLKNNNTVIQHSIISMTQDANIAAQAVRDRSMYLHDFLLQIEGEIPYGEEIQTAQVMTNSGMQQTITGRRIKGKEAIYQIITATVEPKEKQYKPTDILKVGDFVRLNNLGKEQNNVAGHLDGVAINRIQDPISRVPTIFKVECNSDENNPNVQLLDLQTNNICILPKEWLEKVTL